ncbi:FixH family protein [Litorisediminicola beolgyonensis]|uniref:FixH family protein n=1 Tax=Litorisediminicola beolgyonensis TaxID=1173614 RepID=A0ABW3ZHI6_9RHOB
MTELTGRHVAAVFVFGFGIIIAVNIALAVNAVSTFPGLEVPNSYIASQEFDARREAQEALGWSVAAEYRDGRLTLALTDRSGQLAPVERLELHVGRPTEERDDLPVALGPDRSAMLDLAPGLWRLDVTAEARDGTPFEYRAVIEVPR